MDPTRPRPGRGVARTGVSRALLAGWLLLAGCTAERGSGTVAPASVVPTPGAAGSSPTTASQAPGPSESAERAAQFLPSPDRPIPRRPQALADQLAATTLALRSSIDEWLATSAGRPPTPLLLQALFQQRLYGRLAREPALARNTLARLPPPLQGPAAANVTARTELLSLVSPVTGPIRLRTRQPFPPGQLLRSFREAERRFGVAWEVLAAVMFVESRFGRVRSASSAGAQGPMQFIPATWEAYGMGGDVSDPGDAVLGAANYLRASGAPGDYRRALYAYNHAWPYVDAVLLYARQMMRDPRNYYAYHSWQVYVRTDSGLRRLTGPGLD